MYRWLVLGATAKSLLIQLWGEGVQEQLEGAKRNKHVYEKIARQMKEKDIDKTADQCRTKMTKLKLDYRKIKDKHNKTGKGRKNWNNWMHWILY